MMKPMSEVNLSPKVAKSQTRGRKRRSARVTRRVTATESRAGLVQQVEAYKRKLARSRERLDEAVKHQTAAGKVMRIISSSPIQSVLDAVAENAAHLCKANNAEIFRLENNLLRLVASYGEIPVNIQAREGIPANRERVIGRAACDCRTVQVRNLAAEDREFPAGSSDAKREGHRTTLATPLLHEGVPIGVILMRRWEIRPFSAKQIALLENFADHAVIAIENARLFEAEKQHSLALARANRDLAEREAKIRRLVDANIVGIFIWEIDDRIVEANDAFLLMIGYDRADLALGLVHRKGLTPPEWSDRDEQTLRELKTQGTILPFEKEYSRKDGSRVPVLVGLSRFDEDGNEGVAFVIDLTERKQAEEAIRESEYRARQIIETVPSLLWSAGPDGEPTHVSQRLLDYSGMRFEDFSQMGWKEFVHPDDFPETANTFFHAIQTGTSYQAVNRLRRADGEYRWHHTRGEPLRDQDGRIIQWYGLSVDIDELKNTEGRLRRSEGYLAETQRLSQTGTLVLDATAWQYIYLSEESYRIWGLDPLQGLPSHETIRQRFHPDDRDRVWEKVQEALRDKKDYSGEFRIVVPDGSVKYLAITAHHLFSTNGELIEVIATSVDVTERKRAEVALRESEAKFRDYAETASDWLWEVGPDYKFTLLTENAFGSDPADRIGTVCWANALDLETEPEKWRQIWATLDSRKPFRDFVYCAMGGDGSPMYVKASAKPVFDASGKFRGYRGTGTDVTAMMRAQRAEASLRTVEAELARVTRITTLGQLTASIAHEVNQPIAAARNNAIAARNFLSAEPPDLGEVREALDCIVGDADRAGQIIDRIRDHVKKAPPRRDRFDLNEAIDEVIVLARGTIINNGVSVDTRLAEGALHVDGDRVQLQQVVLNLIVNAVEAMGSVRDWPRELTISTQQTKAKGVLVAVRDSGPGIDPENIDRVFEAFYTTKFSGVGMGLSICRSIIDAHGGRLWAEAAEPHATIFRFTLPGVESEFANSAAR
jgi:PAS domain S-box-containing protein